jgi:hypothetical protein
VPDQVSGTLAFKPEYRRLIVRAKDRSVVRGRWKLVYQPLREGYLLRLYDTAQDPDCLQDRLALEPGVAETLVAQLREFLLDDDILLEDSWPESAIAAG